MEVSKEQVSVQDLINNFPWTTHQDRVVVLPDPPDTVLPSGIIIPDTAQEKPQCGVIIALGDELSINLKIIEHLVALRKAVDPKFKEEETYTVNSKTGDRVLFGKYAGLPIKINNVDYLAMRYSDIMATLRAE